MASNKGKTRRHDEKSVPLPLSVDRKTWPLIAAHIAVSVITAGLATYSLLRGRPGKYPRG